MDGTRLRKRVLNGFTAALVVACLALGFALLQPRQALADPSESESFTVKTISSETYQVAAYGLFTAEVNDETNAAAKVNWGTDSDGNSYKDAVLNYIKGEEYSAYVTKYGFSDAEDAEAALSYIATQIEASSGIPTKVGEESGSAVTGPKATSQDSFATGLAWAIASSPTVSAKEVKAGEGAKFENLTEGFYLFYAEGLPPMWTPVGGTESSGTVKDTLQLAAVKTVWDETGSTWGKIAAAGNGSAVKFRVRGEAPNTVPPEGTVFSYKLTDTLPSGLALVNDSVKVYAYDGSKETDITGYFAVATNGQTVTVTCADLYSNSGESASLMRSGAVTHVIFEYAAAMSEEASCGTTYNENKAVISYKKGNISNETEEAAARVTSFGIMVKKVDAAGFLISSADAKFTLTTSMDGARKYVQENGSLSDDEFVFTTSNGEFSVSNIPAGTYALSETESPEGYKMPAVATTNVTITPRFNQEDGILDDMTVTIDNADDATVEKNVSDGLVTVTLKNEPKTTLPITGMEPSQLGTIVGALLVACGIVALLVRARRKARA